MPLRDRPLPPEKDDLHPGYPAFVEGTFGREPLQPPLGVLAHQTALAPGGGQFCGELRAGSAVYGDLPLRNGGVYQGV